MDMDCCGDGSNLYDDLASLIPSTDDYSLDDIDEILRSTDSHLDSSIDLNTFVPRSAHQQVEQNINASYNDFNFQMPIAGSADANSYSEGGTPAYGSQRTSSTSSIDDNFNPDDFMNFLNDDVKMKDVAHDATMDMPPRNTPSPTGSCTSSSGSSTSGIQSDASSVTSQTQMGPDNSPLRPNNDNLCPYPDVPSVDFVIKTAKSHMPSGQQARSPRAIITSAPAPTPVSSVSTALPITVPLLPVQSSTLNTGSSILQTLPRVQPGTISVLPGTIIPVKTVPMATVTPVSNIHTPTPIKIEPKLAPKVPTPPNVQPMSMKVVTSPTPTSSGKITPPPNAKPKTVFLSFNDYKALTQINSKGGKATNGQGPKIILKTSNGKLITANKIVSGANMLNISNGIVPKILKNAGSSSIIKQHHSKLDSGYTGLKMISNGGSVSPKSVAASSTVPAASNLSIYKGLIDEKMMKKQQRMIKNRESASLSRKKKKEYVVSLEARISNLEKENYTLRGENSSLRSQLVALAQSCQCKNSNISEFVLNSLNINAKGGPGSEHHHVKIAPKPPGVKSVKQRIMAANVRKNVALLFAMAFMVTMNVGNFQTYLNKNPIENTIEASAGAAVTGAVSEELHSGGRRLLWVETEGEFKEKLLRNKRETELEVPPLHFLQPVNRTKVTTADHSLNDTTNDAPPTKCAGGSNYTDNVRLHSNLHKWIDGNDYLNLSMHGKPMNNFEKKMRLKYVPDYFGSNSIDVPIGQAGRQKRKYLGPEVPVYENKHRKLADNLHAGIRRNNGVDYENENEHDIEKNALKNSLDIFKPKISEEYIRLFKGIKRQDDTFYVLSFNTDHILLPASAYNKTARPKMSLMLPAGDPSLNGDIVLMQIDCEVTNTTELELKSHMIPEKLRPQKYGGGNFQAPSSSKDVVNNETQSQHEPKNDNVTVREEIVKQKPVPRTYFMMGPKNQGASNVLKKKPTIVKLSAGESFGGIAVNIKNSTLFTKMREKVEGE